MTFDVLTFVVYRRRFHVMTVDAVTYGMDDARESHANGAYGLVFPRRLRTPPARTRYHAWHAAQARCLLAFGHMAYTREVPSLRGIAVQFAPMTLERRSLLFAATSGCSEQGQA